MAGVKKPGVRKKRISADTLLELSLATLRNDIEPHLPADKRFALEMVANAIEISRRELAADTESPLWELLDELYEPGEGSPKQLATDIRSGTVSETKTPGLGARLLKMLEAELAVRNPKFLQTTV
jgi:hypothetical protein